jgi:hypothetical protein
MDFGAHHIMQLAVGAWRTKIQRRPIHPQLLAVIRLANHVPLTDDFRYRTCVAVSQKEVRVAAHLATGCSPLTAPVRC